jgi:hypothetical protein
MEKRRTMTVLLYSTGEAGGRLQKVIRDLVPKDKLEVYTSLEGFSDRLRKPMDDIPVAVILAASENDLLTILSISHLLYDVRFILVLPDREDPTVAIGHSLRPRFLSYTDSDFREVTAVLGKMMGGFYYRGKAREPAGGRTYASAHVIGHQPYYKKFAS